MTRRLQSMIAGLAGLAATLGGGLAAAAPVAPAPDPALDVYLTPQTLATLPDGRHIHLFCRGEGAPVAVVAPGWHVPSLGWRRMQASMAKLTRVCVYDRAGYGFSDPGPMPRDTAAEVKDLHGALAAAGIKGPFVLVGHSLGGFDARLFAYTYPNETAGLLLLDPPTERIYQRTREPDEDIALMKRCAALARANALVPHGEDGCLGSLGPAWSAAMRAKFTADQNRAVWFETLISEDVSMVNRSSDELVAARRRLGSIPLVILQADADCPAPGRRLRTEGERFDAARCAEFESQARDSARGERRIVSGASHMVQDDKPEVVLAAFAEVIRQARASGLATAAR